MTTPVGGYAPGTNDVPGMQGGRDATNGGHRNVAFLDAGACSKMLRSLPSMTSFFRNVRKSVSGLQQQSSSNTSAIKNLLHAQANLNDQSNQLNYWMKKTSPELDKLHTELVAGNDALGSMTFEDGAVAPNCPDGILLVPGPSAGSFVLYYVEPSYIGTTPITKYQVDWYPTATDALTNGTSIVVNSADALPTGGYATSADGMYEIYGESLRVLTTLPTGSALCVRVRAANTSGASSAELWSEWSAPTLLCTPAASGDLVPAIRSIVTGCDESLVEWRLPQVRQPDGSYVLVAGLHSFKVTGSPAPTVVAGDAVSVAQIPLSAGAAVSVTVAAYSDEAGATIVATSAAAICSVPAAMPAPSLSARLVTSGSDTYALLTCSLPNYYSPVQLSYEVTSTIVTGSTAISAITGLSQDPATVMDASMNATIRVPSSGFFAAGATYSFTAKVAQTSGTVGSVLGPASQPVNPWSGSGSGSSSSGGGGSGGFVGASARTINAVPSAATQQAGGDQLGMIKQVLALRAGDNEALLSDGGAINLSIAPFTRSGASSFARIPPSLRTAAYVVGVSMVANDNGTVFAFQNSNTSQVDAVVSQSSSSSGYTPFASMDSLPTSATSMALSNSSNNTVGQLLVIPKGTTFAVFYATQPVVSWSIVSANYGNMITNGNLYLGAFMGGSGATQRLVLVTTDGEAHFYTVDGTTGLPASSTPQVLAINGSSNVTTGMTVTESRWAMNSDGTVFIMYNGNKKEITTAVVNTTTGVWSLQGSPVFNARISSQAGRLGISSAGNFFIADERITGGYNSLDLGFSLWRWTGSTWVLNSTEDAAQPYIFNQISADATTVYGNSLSDNGVVAASLA
jgi:hypothetical protein